MKTYPSFMFRLMSYVNIQSLNSYSLANLMNELSTNDNERKVIEELRGSEVQHPFSLPNKTRTSIL